PEHDHSEDGQEEVYVTLRGSGEWDIEGERVPVDPEMIVRISAGTKRKLLPGPEGIRVLALGGVPGKLYERPEPFKLGAPDPTATAAGQELLVAPDAQPALLAARGGETVWSLGTFVRVKLDDAPPPP